VCVDGVWGVCEMNVCGCVGDECVCEGVWGVCEMNVCVRVCGGCVR
jgi:hypothetical protein